MSSPSYTKFRALMSRSAFSEAAGLAERESLAEGDRTAFWFTQHARALLKLGKAADAQRSIERALKLDPDNRWALLARSDLLLRQGRTGEACRGYEELLRFTDVRSSARRGLLECVSKQKDWQRILSLVGEWGVPLEAAAEWQVQALQGLGRRDEAADLLRDWLKRSPDNPRALWRLTELEVEAEGVEPVRTRMGRLAKIPGRPPVYGEIYASLCRRAGVADAALGQYEKLVRQESTPRLLRKQAFTLAKSGREAEAAPLMEELLRMNPQDMYIHSSYIAACRRMNDLERAYNFYQELLALFPDERSLYGRLRRVQKSLG